MHTVDHLSSPREVKSKETVERIVSAATSIIESGDLSKLTVKNVCKLAGVSNGVFFHFFKSKNDLIIQYMHDGYEKYIAENPFDPTGTDIIDRIIYFYIHNVKYCQNIGVEFIHYYYTTENKALAGRDIKNLVTGPCYDNVIALVRQGQETGYFKNDCSAFEITADLGMLVKGVIFEWALCEGNFDVERYIDKMCRIYLNSIRTEQIKQQ